MRFIEELIAQFEDESVGWDWASRPDTAEISRWRAFRLKQKPILRTLSNWKEGRRYVADSLAGRMSRAFADFMAGTEPVVKPADPTDQQELLDPMLKANKFGQKVRDAIDTCVSEREVWYRIFQDPDQMQYPVLEFSSRIDVVPLMVGNHILAAAFSHTHQVGQGENAKFYRHVEFYEENLVVNKLYEIEGLADAKLGTEVGLDLHPQLSEDSPPMVEEWMHDCGMLCGILRNGENPRSIYEDVDDFLLDLNETHSVDSENYRLTGKKRAVMDKQFADQAGEVDPGEEIYFYDDDANEMEAGNAVMKVIEYDYDADASIKRKEDQERLILTRVGLARQLVDANVNEGLAQTGTALKVRLLPTIAAISGLSKEVTHELPYIVWKMIKVDALPEGQHGWGRPWSKVSIEQMPNVTLAAPLPEDTQEEAQKHQTLISAELESIETAIEELRPNWSAERRKLEVMRILANREGYALDDDGKPITLESDPSDTDDESDKISEEPRASEESPAEEGVTSSEAASSEQGAGVGAG